MCKIENLRLEKHWAPVSVKYYVGGSCWRCDISQELSWIILHSRHAQNIRQNLFPYFFCDGAKTNPIWMCQRWLVVLLDMNLIQFGRWDVLNHSYERQFKFWVWDVIKFSDIFHLQLSLYLKISCLKVNQEVLSKM